MGDAESGDRGAHMLRNILRIQTIRIGEHDGKLDTRVARAEIERSTGAPGDGGGNLPDAVIAGLRTEAIVVTAEVVGIHQHQDDQGFVDDRLLPDALEIAVEDPPVENTGETVALTEMRDDDRFQVSRPDGVLEQRVGSRA